MRGTLLDRFPPRRTNPLWRAQSYVDRRVGMPDRARERRRERAARRGAK